MENNTQQSETAQRLRDFHEQSKNVKSKKEPRHSEDILQFCAVVIIIISILSCPILCFAYGFNFFLALWYAFGGFTFGILLYVVAKICRLLDIIKDK